MMEERIRDLELKVTEMKGDVSHIKDRIDNGLSKTLTELSKQITEVLPHVRDNTFWVSKVKWGCIWIAVIGVGGGMVSLLWHFVNKGA